MCHVHWQSLCCNLEFEDRQLCRAAVRNPLCTTAADVLWHSSALVTAALQHEVMCQFPLQARGFGAAQVSHLVCALFEPTEFRARLIEEIEG